jgi:hypothetical protein
MIQILIPILLVILSGISKAIMDTIQFHFEKSHFKGEWFNPSISWNNKYTWSSNKIISWLIQNTLVFITDAWHFFGMIQRVSLFSILFFHITWWWVPILYSIFALTFHIFFTYILIKK